MIHAMIRTFLAFLLATFATYSLAVGSKISCEPAAGGPPNAVVNGYLIVGKYQEGHLVNEKNIQPKMGKLVVDKRSKTDLVNNGKKFQILSCSVPPSYAPPSAAPFNLKDAPVLAGQLSADDYPTCVTVKNGTVGMADCAKTDSDTFAAQWFHFVGNYMVHAGATGSPLEAKVTVKHNKLTSMSHPSNASSFVSLYLDESPYDVHASDARQRISPPIIVTATFALFVCMISLMT